jgi:hypothetical protein
LSILVVAGAGPAASVDAGELYGTGNLAVAVGVQLRIVSGTPIAPVGGPVPAGD